MRFLAVEKLSSHKYKTPEGYLICVDAILSRTGKQEYKRSELFGDTCDNADEITYVDRTDDEVFSEKSLASFENKAICLEHPEEDVNVENHNDLSIGFVRDIHKGTVNGQSVMMGTLVFTDKDAIELIESGEYKELSCGYDCDIVDEDKLMQRNIRGNHIALCKQGRAGIARIVDSVKDIQPTKNSDTDEIIYVMQSDTDKDLYFYIGKKYSMKEGNFGYTKFEMNDDTPEKIKAELTKNGWHQVTKGKVSIIDYEWVDVEEENYKKANKAVIDENYVQLPRGKFKVVTKTKEELKKENYNYHHSANGYSVYAKNNQAVAIKDTTNEKLFTVEYEQDGITHVYKVRANTLNDAIKKVKDKPDPARVKARVDKNLKNPIIFSKSKKGMHVRTRIDADDVIAYLKSIGKDGKFEWNEKDGMVVYFK